MHRIFTLIFFALAWLNTCLAAETAPLPPSPAESRPAPQIALLLPLKSASFVQPAETVRKGFMTGLAAAATHPTVKVYATDDTADDILRAYLLAVQEGAKTIVGPITRNAVSILAANDKMITVPTLALNTPEGEEAIPFNLYLFGLSLEAEARQIARIAFTEGKRSAFVVAADTPLARRVQQAFLDEWEDLDAEIAGQAIIAKNQAEWLALRELTSKANPDMIFLAADVAKARLVRPYLNPSAPTYATSQVYAGNGTQIHNVDLNGVRFIDMPWLLEPDHPAVMVYPKPDPLGSVELERLYALGIDAFRLANALLQGEVRSNFVLDGITGKITLQDQTFERELSYVQFQEGSPLMINKPKEAPELLPAPTP